VFQSESCVGSSIPFWNYAPSFDMVVLAISFKHDLLPVSYTYCLLFWRSRFYLTEVSSLRGEHYGWVSTTLDSFSSITQVN
jgi:hypothetical protein